MKQNAFLAKQERRNAVRQQAMGETVRVFMAEMMCLVLNDPEIMGRGVFGRDRLTKIKAAVEERADAYWGAMLKCPEADYKQVMLDREMQRIFGEDCPPFGARYPWIAETRTGVKK